mmetsp:Transcript_56784/g.99277  ORF Transcript_56784/g.99277 Transcript_56784/m.99277 type:complete len:223 (-) Transcript_56784:32-700(-)
MLWNAVKRAVAEGQVWPVCRALISFSQAAVSKASPLDANNEALFRVCWRASTWAPDSLHCGPFQTPKKLSASSKALGRRGSPSSRTCRVQPTQYKGPPDRTWRTALKNSCPLPCRSARTAMLCSDAQNEQALGHPLPLQAPNGNFGAQNAALNDLSYGVCNDMNGDVKFEALRPRHVHDASATASSLCEGIAERAARHSGTGCITGNMPAKVSAADWATVRA